MSDSTTGAKGSGLMRMITPPVMRTLSLIPLVFLNLPASAVDFSREIRPILSENCFFCHGPDEKKREADLRLDDEAAAKKDNDGVIAVVPGDPGKSALIQRLLSTDPDEVMPPPKQHKTISVAQVALLKEWIKQGAPWGKHWSYEKVVKPAVPELNPSVQSLVFSDQLQKPNTIDVFLAQRLAKEGLKYSPEADAATLIRRVALDVTGLPPTLEELTRFQSQLKTKHLSPNTFSELVDHYIAKPAYGEHWAREWLDLARYADSAGYPSDPGREIWTYRDWVIRALNANMPFDQFTIEQLAGDLLPNPTQDQLIATAFHRNTMTQNEGGTSDEEFRSAAIVDRVNTTYAVWMGTTMACAQCHTHKYDPLTHKEYFQSYAFFNQSADADRKDESPLHLFDTPELLKEKQQIKTELAAIETKFAKPEAAWLSGLPAWEKVFGRELAWQKPKPAKVTTQSGQQAVISDDGSISISKRSDTDSYTVELPVTAGKLSALRLETMTAPGFGNFVLTEVNAQLVPPANQPAPVARFVRVELPGKDKMLQLAEVQVFSAGDNVAFRRPAKQSSIYMDAEARRAVDGTTDGEYAKGSVAHTSGKEMDPWWEVELKTDLPIERVVVWNRTDGGASTRLEGFRVMLLDAKRQTIWKSEPTAAPAKDKAFAVGGPVSVVFTTAMADFEQSGFTAASLLLPKDKTQKGWAIAGATDKPHTLTLLCASPVVVPAGSILRVSLVQKSEIKQHTLGKFRLGFTDDALVQQVTALPPAVLAVVTTDTAKRTPAQQHEVIDYYLRNVAKESAADRKQLVTLNKQLAALKPLTVPIMKDLAGAERRKTMMQMRGNWQVLGDEVSEGTPAVFPSLPAGAPKDRLTLAKSSASRDNPLTARVTVNRMWESLFGTGIVRTSEEFGSQGDLPLHPELLDWLAADFMESGWNVKHTLKLMLMTQAYRQDSRSTDELNERDPDNRFLARGPRFRATGELLRDQALAVSGLLNSKLYGKPVRPLRPSLGLTTAFGGTNDWVTSEGADKHRRSLYTEIKRNSPYPSFTTFDAGNREVCNIRRGRTNTPLQAFVTLNDPVFVETNQAMARKVFMEAKDSQGRLGLMFKLCVSREPSARELAALTKLHDESLVMYQASKDEALKMATDPIGPAQKEADIAKLAAWTAVANVVMNLDEFLMRR
jgi:hypothetical protein